MQILVLVTKPDVRRGECFFSGFSMVASVSEMSGLAWTIPQLQKYIYIYISVFAGFHRPWRVGCLQRQCLAFRLQQSMNGN